jgi:hypothetical protein
MMTPQLCIHCDHRLTSPVSWDCRAVGTELDFVTGEMRAIPCREVREHFGAECPHYSEAKGTVPCGDELLNSDAPLTLGQAESALKALGAHRKETYGR